MGSRGGRSGGGREGLKEFARLGSNGGSGIFGQERSDQFPCFIIFLLSAADFGSAKEALAREFEKVVIVEIDFLIVGNGQIERIQWGFADPLIELRRGDFFGGERFEGLGKGEHRLGLHFVGGVGAFDDSDPQLEGGGILFIPVVLAGLGQGLGTEEVGFLDFVGPGIVTGKFCKILFRFGFAVRFEIDLAETKKSGGLGMLAGIFRADLGGELLADPLKDRASFFSLPCGKESLGKALEIFPIQSGLRGQRLFVGFLVKAEGEGGLTSFEGDAGLGEEDLGNESGLITRLAGEISERLETILNRSLP